MILIHNYWILELSFTYLYIYMLLKVNKLHDLYTL